MIQQSEESKNSSISLMWNGKETRNKVRVFCRFRPFSEAEKGMLHVPAFEITDTVVYRKKEQVNNEKPSKAGNRSSTIVPNESREQYVFDGILGETATQQETYQVCAQSQIDNALLSNASTCFSIMTFGQTCSGKTFSLLGDYRSSLSPKAGILPRSINHVFDFIEGHNELQIKVKCSAVEIYCGCIYDLSLSPKNRTPLQQKDGTMMGKGKPKQFQASSASELSKHIFNMIANRCVSATDFNNQSSRSHAIFMINLEKIIEDMKITSKIYLVDLAGSQKVKTEGDDKIKKQGTFINQSLSALEKCIKQLSENKQASYRENVLTRALRPCFQGNCKATILINVQLSDENGESVKSMRFGQCVRLVKPRPAPQKILKAEEQGSIAEIYDKVVTLAKVQIFRLIDSLEKAEKRYNEEKKQRERLESQLGTLRLQHSALLLRCSQYEPECKNQKQQ